MKVFKSTKHKLKVPTIYGFDIETYKNNKKLYCWSIYGEGYKKQGFTKEEFIETIKEKRFRSSKIIATNLGFDFFGLFFNNKILDNFRTLFRGSSLIGASVYYNKHTKSFQANSGSSCEKIEFLDSMNFTPFGVAKLGKIINIDKLKKPVALGKLPRNKKDKEELLIYNMRDSEITFKFMNFLFKSLVDIGANIQNTIGSTAISLFRNKYLGDNQYYINDRESILFQFQSYFGGRTEVFKRGKVKKIQYYHDFNSLYPSVMEENEFPDPNSSRITYINSLKYINTYEGCSEVEIFCPEMQHPLLPYRLESGKVLFPTGNFKGTYTHIELREAIRLGYIIKKVCKTNYFLRTCRPFKAFVQDCYKLRMKYKMENNPVETIIKLIMNALSGKFGQKFESKDNWTPINSMTKKDIDKMAKIEVFGQFARTEENGEPSLFCFPIWISYITAFGRLKLHKAIVEHDPIYVDTDSLTVDHKIQDSKVLGELKIEYTVLEGIFVRPKFYGMRVIDDKGKYLEFARIKGCGRRITFKELETGLKNNDVMSVVYPKFTKFKEAVRRGFVPNEIIMMEKFFDLNDNKRVWDKEKFSTKELVNSKPIELCTT